MALDVHVYLLAITVVSAEQHQNTILRSNRRLPWQVTRRYYCHSWEWLPIYGSKVVRLFLRHFDCSIMSRNPDLGNSWAACELPYSKLTFAAPCKTLE